MNRDLSVSVALCTYNGATYLPSQLSSFSRQERQPDELVVGDDGSTDDSLGVVQAFADKALFPVRLQANPSNLGSTKNFEHTISRCAGEAVALCDQDDEWLTSKLAQLIPVLESGVGYTFTDGWLVDSSGELLGGRLWKAIGFGRGEQARFAANGGLPSLLRRNVVTGATMVFRAEYKPLVLPIPDCWVHDGWIAILISAVSKGRPVSEPLIRYRQHASQQIGEKKRGFLNEYRIAKQQGRAYFDRQLEAFTAVLERLESQTLFEPHSFALPLLREKIAHCERRLAMRTYKSWRAPAVVSGLARGRYARLDRGWKAAAQDLFL